MEKKAPPSLPPWLARMLPFTRYRVDVGGVNMHVMEQGEGFPVVMLHGNPSWGFLYRKVMLELTGVPMRLIVPDLIGFGLSDKPRSRHLHDLEQHATWVRHLLEELELESLVFVGQDWGGPIGLRALSEMPETLAGLVLMNTVVGPPKPGFTPTLFHQFSHMPLVSDLAFEWLGFPQNAMWAAQGQRWSIRGKVAKAYRYPLEGRANRSGPLALARMVPDSLQHPSVVPLTTVHDFVDEYEGPAALVWGDRDPILGRVRGRVERLLPQAKVWHTQAGHFLQEEVPDTIAQAVQHVVWLAEK